MLPHFKTSAISFVAALAIAATSAAPAAAWGQREQDTLKGAVGALVLKAIIDDARRDRAPVYQEPVYRDGPVYHEPQQPRRHHSQHGQSHSVYATPAAHAFNSYSRAERKLIQRRLAHWGYYRGGIDGSFGPGTYSAVAAYAQDQGQSLNSTARAFGVYDGLIY